MGAYRLVSRLHCGAKATKSLTFLGAPARIRTWTIHVAMSDHTRAGVRVYQLRHGGLGNLQPVPPAVELPGHVQGEVSVAGFTLVTNLASRHLPSSKR